MLEALTLSEARYQGLVENLPDSTVHLFDHDLRLLLVEGGRLRAPRLRARGDRGPAARARSSRPRRSRGSRPHYRAALAGETRSFDFDAPDGTATTGCRSRRCATRPAA